MPLWDDLGEALHHEFDPSYKFSNTLDSISAYEHTFSRVRLVEKLRELLMIDDARPGQAHQAFCSVRFDVIATTNFDFLLENTYNTEYRPYTPVVGEDQLSISISGVDQATLPHVRLIKLHGDLNHPDSLVVTEADYERFLQARPLLSTFFANLLISRTAVLIGYSLDDTDLRQVWSVVNSRLGSLRRPAYTIQVDAKDDVRSRYERRGVRVINLPSGGREYGEVLALTFKEIREFWSDHPSLRSRSAPDARPIAAAAPEISQSGYLYFSAPPDTEYVLLDAVLTAASISGMAVVRREDADLPRGNLAATVDSLIKRAGLAIIMHGSSWSLYEAGIAIDRLGREHVLILHRNDDAAARGLLDLAATRSLTFDESSYKDPKLLVERIATWIRGTPRQTVDPLAEAEELLRGRHYRAALIAAATALEGLLRLNIAKREIPADFRASLGRLLQFAVRAALISKEDFDRLVELSRARNEAVHLSVVVKRQEAMEAIELVRRIQQQMG